MNYCICEGHFGHVDFFGGNSTVSEIHSALVFRMYDLWNMQCSMDGPMYHLDSQYGAHDVLLIGLL